MKHTIKAVIEFEVHPSDEFTDLETASEVIGHIRQSLKDCTFIRKHVGNPVRPIFRVVKVETSAS